MAGSPKTFLKPTTTTTSYSHTVMIWEEPGHPGLRPPASSAVLISLPLQSALLGPVTCLSWPRHPMALSKPCQDHGGHVVALHLGPWTELLCGFHPLGTSCFCCDFALGEALQPGDGAWPWNQSLGIKVAPPPLLVWPWACYFSFITGGIKNHNSTSYLI